MTSRSSGITPAEVFAEFLRLEAEGNARPHGADHPAIVLALAELSGRTPAEVSQIIRSRTVMGPN